MPGLGRNSVVSSSGLMSRCRVEVGEEEEGRWSTVTVASLQLVGKCRRRELIRGGISSAAANLEKISAATSSGLMSSREEELLLPHYLLALVLGPLETLEVGAEGVEEELVDKREG